MSEQKLSERLQQLAYESRVGARDTLLLKYSECMEIAFGEAALLAQALEAENGRLLKRVAELEAKQCAHEAELAVAHEFIADLQAQLAWAPVSKGLPTEEGPYEFTHVSDDSAIIHDFELWLYNPHEDEFESVTSADVYVRDEFLDNNYYTHYRRIELPEGGES